MDTIEPTLFDLPAQGAPAPQHRPQPGRKGETWACAVSAMVTVLDAQALRDAASQAETNAVTMEFDADLPDDERIPGAWWHVEPGAGHFPWHESPGCLMTAMDRLVRDA